MKEIFVYRKLFLAKNRVRLVSVEPEWSIPIGTEGWTISDNYYDYISKFNIGRDVLSVIWDPYFFNTYSNPMCYFPERLEIIEDYCLNKESIINRLTKYIKTLENKGLNNHIDKINKIFYN